MCHDPVSIGQALVSDTTITNVSCSGVHWSSTGVRNDHYSQEEIKHGWNWSTDFFLSIDSRLYMPKIIFFRGCAQFHKLAFFKSNMAAATAKYH